MIRLNWLGVMLAAAGLLLLIICVPICFWPAIIGGILIVAGYIVIRFG